MQRMYGVSILYTSVKYMSLKRHPSHLFPLNVTPFCIPPPIFCRLLFSFIFLILLKLLCICLYYVYSIRSTFNLLHRKQKREQYHPTTVFFIDCRRRCRHFNDTFVVCIYFRCIVKMSKRQRFLIPNTTFACFFYSLANVLLPLHIILRYILFMSHAKFIANKFR